MKTLFLAFALLLAFSCAARCEFMDDDVSMSWSKMSDADKKNYLSGVTNAFTVMCGVQSTNATEYKMCRDRYSQRKDLPGSLYSLFTEAYTNKKYPDVPSDMLLHFWATGKTSAPELQKAQAYAKERRKAYGGKHQ